MSSGTIVEGNSNKLMVEQANGSIIFGASSWTGGEIGGGTNLVFKVLGSSDHPMTLNVSNATSTPKFSGAKWWIGKSASVTDTTVNWVQGNIDMVPPGTLQLGAEIQNEGTFNALSTGKISATAPKRWMFTNDGNLILVGDKQFERCRLLPRSDNIFKKAGLDGTPGTFTLVGDVDQEGGNVLVQSGTFVVTEGYTENAGTVALSADTTLAITGAMAENGGTLTIGENTNGATLTATAGVQVAAGALLSGWGSIVADVSNAGEVDKQGGTLAITGAYTQLPGATTNMYGGTFHVSSYLDEQGGTFTLTGTVQADLGMLIESGALLYGNGTINVVGTLTNAGTINLAGGSGPGQTPGILAVNGDYTQTSTGVLDIHLYAANSSDALQVSGLATLDGTLNVYDNGSFLPTAGNVFVVVTYGSRSGTFAGISLPAVSFGHWDDPHWDDPSYPDALSLWVLYP
jgi:formylmethanofuran dehydrogenase subunit C